jgi:hypothetical protein
MKKSTMKYNKRIGQKTGTSKTSKNVITMAMIVERVQECQNLNSDSRRAKGLKEKKAN